ncbi:hypothetical protein [Streptomyces sp. NPDC057413]
MVDVPPAVSLTGTSRSSADMVGRTAQTAGWSSSSVPVIGP